MPETDSSSNTGADERASCSTLLRQGARDLRALAAAAAPRRCAACKEQLLATIHRVLVASTSAPRRSGSCGSGPTRTTASTATGWMTPQEFAAPLRRRSTSTTTCASSHDPRAEQPARPDLHRRVPRQRRRRAPRDLPQRRRRPAEVADDGHDRRRRAGLVRLRRRQDDQRRARHLGRRASTTTTRVYGTELDLGQGRPAAAPRLDDDPRDALHRRRRRRRRPAPLAGREQLGRREGRQGLLHDERLVVRRVRLRDRRAPRPRCRRSCRRRWTTSRSCCRPGTRWAPWPAS